LTSCASREHVVTVSDPVAQRSPEILRTCADAPDVPGPEATNHEIAAFMLKLSAAGEDCRRKLAARNQWEDEAAARVEGD
jgi:hypothetical protein